MKSKIQACTDIWLEALRGKLFAMSSIKTELLSPAQSRTDYQRLAPKTQLGKTFARLQHKRFYLEFVDVSGDLVNGTVLILENSDFALWGAVVMCLSFLSFVVSLYMHRSTALFIRPREGFAAGRQAELVGARSPLYRSQILRPNTHLTQFFKIYNMGILLHRSIFSDFRKTCAACRY